MLQYYYNLYGIYILYLCGYVQTERRDEVVSKLASLSQTRVDVSHTRISARVRFAYSAKQLCIINR